MADFRALLNCENVEKIDVKLIHHTKTNPIKV